MRISNSGLKDFLYCPAFYQEKHLFEIERIVGEDSKLNESLLFGSRIHQLLAEYYRGVRPSTLVLSEALEAEAQLTFEAYKAHYPVEDFEFVEAEYPFELPLPGGKHSLSGIIDGLIVAEDGETYNIFETKTEQRGSKANHPQAWKSKTQVGVYLWAARKLWPEKKIDKILLNVITRQSEKGREPPTFRRDDLQRTDAQINEALSTVEYVADQISYLKDTRDCSLWPTNRENCVSRTGWVCEYNPLHGEEGRGDLVLLNYKPRSRE
jgi:hypothetical protein